MNCGVVIMTDPITRSNIDRCYCLDSFNQTLNSDN